MSVRRFVPLPLDFYETECWQNWFTDGLNHNVFIYLGDSNWLVIEIRSQETPGLLVFVLEMNQKNLIDTIHNRCNGMLVRSCNLDGVNTDNDPTTPTVLNPETDKKE